MRLSDLIEHIESSVPLSFQENWDNAGLQVGCPEQEVTDVLLCIDVTKAVLDEAKTKKCQLIVSHHPLLFHGLKTLRGATDVEKIVMEAIRSNVAVYSAHTNMDNWQQGVNARIAAKLGLQQTAFLKPFDSDENIGSGMIGMLPNPEDEVLFLQRIKDIFHVPMLRYTQLLNKPVRKVALCGGAGSFLLAEAIGQQADVYLSADFKYHEFFQAEQKIVIADIGHYESEQYTKEIFFELISKKIPTFAIHFSETDSSPINYL